MLDKLDCMRLFVRVIERRNFRTAAADLGLAASTATDAIKRLETRLGARLIERTTRHVSATHDGQAYYQRCIAILGDVDAAEASLSGAAPQGLLRVNVHGFMARHWLLPGLSAFLQRYPLIDLHIGEDDRLVDLVREGVDCAVRAGDLDDSGLVARRVGLLEEVTCASPAYLR